MVSRMTLLSGADGSAGDASASAPSTPDVDMAATAARCGVVSQALRLVEWVGDGRRVTPTAVLRPADAIEAARALRIDAPRRLRTAADLPALHRPWRTALALGLLSVDGNTVGRGPAAADGWPPAGPNVVVAGWLSAFEAVCADACGDEDDRAALLLCGLALDGLADAPAGLRADRLAVRIQDAATQLPGEDWFIWRQAFRYALDPVAEALVVLESFGAVARHGGLAHLTNLGRRLLADLAARRPAPADPTLPVEELLARLAGLDEDDADIVAGPWVAARPAETAAQELLRAADTAPAASRLAALQVLPMLNVRHAGRAERDPSRRVADHGAVRPGDPRRLRPGPGAVRRRPPVAHLRPGSRGADHPRSGRGTDRAVRRHAR